jgi:uncharacterized protein
MRIQEMTPDLCLALLKRSNLARLACTNAMQPYVVPISFVYHDSSIYGFSTEGQKVVWMRVNPLVCLEIEEIVSRQNWKTVIVFGQFEELTDGDARTMAHGLFAKRASWWEPGYSRTTIAGKPRRLNPIYFRISIDKMTGHQGVESGSADSWEVPQR